MSAPLLRLTPLTDAPPTRATTVGVIIASHNRRLLTLGCLESLVGQEVTTPTELIIVLVDDGGRDGTSEAVRSRFPDIHVVRGSGNLYWGGGMRRAHQVLMEVAEPDYLLWLNDDVTLFRDALTVLLEVADEQPRGIAVGALMDSSSHRTSYSGFIRPGRSPLKLQVAAPSRTVKVDTFNGNLVLFPASAYKALGPIDRAFPHKYGDLDYGYRASKLEIPIRVASRHVGYCVRNTGLEMWQDPSLSRRKRFALLHSVKEKPFRAHAAFVRRHSGMEWPLRFAGGYLKAYWQILVTSDDG